MIGVGLLAIMMGSPYPLIGGFLKILFNIDLKILFNIDIEF